MSFGFFTLFFSHLFLCTDGFKWWSEQSLSWRTLFIIVYWFLWKWRNANIFQDSKAPLNSILLRIMACHDFFASGRQQSNNGWSRILVKCVSFPGDGAVLASECDQSCNIFQLLNAFFADWSQTIWMVLIDMIFYCGFCFLMYLAASWYTWKICSHLLYVSDHYILLI